jgi:methylglutaconyl-CoA hydratase
MTLTVTSTDGIRTLTLARPEVRNALDQSIIEGLLEALDQAELDATVRVVAIRGAGKDFCAGADLREMLRSADLPPEINQASAERLGAVFTRMRRLPKPVVGLVQGRALAGGAGLATACDLVVATDSAQFGYPEVTRGFVPAMVMTMLRRIVGERRAFDLVATGRLLTASEAERWGLVSRVYPDAEFPAATETLLRDLAAASPTALALIKRLFYDLDDQSFAEGIALGARVNAMARMHPDFKDAVAAFLK